MVELKRLAWSQMFINKLAELEVDWSEPKLTEARQFETAFSTQKPFYFHLNTELLIPIRLNDGDDLKTNWYSAVYNNRNNRLWKRKWSFLFVICNCGVTAMQYELTRLMYEFI